MNFVKGLIRGVWITFLVLGAIWAWAVYGLGQDSGRVTYGLGCATILVLPVCCLLMGFAGLTHKDDKREVAGADDPGCVK